MSEEIKQNQDKDYKVMLLKLAQEMFYKKLDTIAVKRQLFKEIDEDTLLKELNEHIEHGFMDHLNVLDKYLKGDN